MEIDSVNQLRDYLVKSQLMTDELGTGFSRHRTAAGPRGKPGGRGVALV